MGSFNSLPRLVKPDCRFCILAERCPYLCNTKRRILNLSRKKIFTHIGICIYIENTASGISQTALHLYYKPTHVYALMTTFIFIFFSKGANAKMYLFYSTQHLWKNCERKVKENLKKRFVYYVVDTFPEILFSLCITVLLFLLLYIHEYVLKCFKKVDVSIR